MGDLNGPAVPEDREPASVEGQPSDEEVAELVKTLKCIAFWKRRIDIRQADRLDRAAALLEQLSASQPLRPIPVSDWLPGDQLCWWFESDDDCGYGSTWTLLRIRGSATGYTHWLPANALPLPEAQP